jgi:hypothetical protein
MRVNQSQKLIFGNITIDGTGNIATITVGNGNTAGVPAKILVGSTIVIEDDGVGNDTITLGTGTITVGNITIGEVAGVATITLGNGATPGTASKIAVGNTMTITDDGNTHGTILVNDGTNNRILIGYGAGLF